jgi:hypothetical protein
MRSGFAMIALAVLAAAGTECVGGEEPDGPPLRPGSHLRIGLIGRSAPVVGTLVHSGPHELQVAVRGEAEGRTLQWEDVALLEVRRSHEWRGFAAGTLVGVGTTAGLIAVFGGAREDVAAGAALAGLGAIPGAAAGAVVGARRSRGEGLAAGVASTAFLFVLLEAASNDPGNDEIPFQAALLAGAALGALSGGAAAAVAHEGWQPVRRPALRVSVLPIRGRGLAAGLTVAF